MMFDINNPSDTALLRAAIQGKKVGLTSGCYDLFHHMHLVYLKRCRRQCDILLVGVDSDDLVRKVKGPERPIVPEHQRVALVSELNCVSAAFIMGELNDFLAAVNLFGVGIIFKNQHFRPEEVLGCEKANVVIIPDVNQFDSTTGIIEEIKKRRTTVIDDKSPA